MSRNLIVNADDFGASRGINRGIIDCHTRGILTSTSLMVTGQALEDAAALSRDHPRLSVGLHWDVWGEDEREFDTDNIPAVREEFRRQLDIFFEWMGTMPTHIDSHQHAHRSENLMPVFQEMVEPLGVPLRGDGRVAYIGGFYAQWEWKVTTLKYVGVPFLEWLLREEVHDGWTELACHPGYITPDFTSVYLAEREEEVRTITDPRVASTITELDIQLRSYNDWAAVAR
ncbi:MAG: ChbG/HpnK family deacetylase [Chloroflexi bacterium]|nr:ChbG/HpnK family deacetylase [Chloroflexota bacterium]